MKHLNEYDNYTFSDQEYTHTQRVYENPRKSFAKACYDKDIETIKDLLKHPSINIESVNSELHEAIAEFNVLVVKALWDYPGLDLQDHGEQLGGWAALNNDVETLQFVLDTKDFDPITHNNSLLQYANSKNSSKCIALLLDDERILNSIGLIEFGTMKEELMNQILKKLGLDSPYELKDVIDLMR